VWFVWRCSRVRRNWLTRSLNKRIDRLETEVSAELRAVKAETRHDALKETQNVLNSVQGGFYDRLADITARVSQLENHVSAERNALCECRKC